MQSAHQLVHTRRPTMNCGNTIARLWIPMIVPPATGPDPLYSTLSSMASISAVEKLRASGVRSSYRPAGLLGLDRHGPMGVDAAREWSGRVLANPYA